MEGQYACTIIFDEYFKTIGVKYCYFKHTFTKKNEKKRFLTLFSAITITTLSLPEPGQSLDNMLA